MKLTTKLLSLLLVHNLCLSSSFAANWNGRALINPTTSEVRNSLALMARYVSDSNGLKNLCQQIKNQAPVYYDGSHSLHASKIRGAVKECLELSRLTPENQLKEINEAMSLVAKNEKKVKVLLPVVISGAIAVAALVSACGTLKNTYGYPLLDLYLVEKIDDNFFTGHEGLPSWIKDEYESGQLCSLNIVQNNFIRYEKAQRASIIVGSEYNDSPVPTDFYDFTYSLSNEVFNVGIFPFQTEFILPVLFRDIETSALSYTWGQQVRYTQIDECQGLCNEAHNNTEITIAIDMDSQTNEATCGYAYFYEFKNYSQSTDFNRLPNEFNFLGGSQCSNAWISNNFSEYCGPDHKITLP